MGLFHASTQEGRGQEGKGLERIGVERIGLAFFKPREVSDE